MANIGRPPSCKCGDCNRCTRARQARERYQALSIEERRAVVRARDQEKVRANDKRRSGTPERLAHTTRNTKRWRDENPEKYAAHVAVGNAIRKGVLVKQPCERCGATGRVHAHHDDYDKPLDVRWLCPLHHAEER